MLDLQQNKGRHDLLSRIRRLAVAFHGWLGRQVSDSNGLKLCVALQGFGRQNEDVNNPLKFSDE